jgi:hypothetical protein
MSLSREPNSHWSEYPTDNPHRHHQKKEEDPHLHIDKEQQEQNLSDYAQQDLSVVTQNHETRHAKVSKVIRTQTYQHLLLITFKHDY